MCLGRGDPSKQDDGKIDQGMLEDVLLDTLQQSLQHLGAHQLGLVINGRVAEPVTIRAVDVASGCNLNKQLRDWLILEGDKIWFVSRHACTECLRGNYSACE